MECRVWSVKCVECRVCEVSGVWSVCSVWCVCSVECGVWSVCSVEGIQSVRSKTLKNSNHMKGSHATIASAIIMTSIK